MQVKREHPALSVNPNRRRRRPCRRGPYRYSAPQASRSFRGAGGKARFQG